MMDQNDKVQMERAWMVIRIVWAALIGSLAVYLIVCKVIENRLHPAAGIPFDRLRNVLTAISVAIFFIAYFVRKSMLKTPEAAAPSIVARNHSSQMQNPLVGRYLAAIIVAMALSESIGIFGLVLFVLGKDSGALYQFLGISALAMFIYRPRKEEFLQLASDMKGRAADSPRKI